MDEYGFERPEDFDYETYEDFMSEYLKVLAKMAKKWAKIIGEGKSLQRSIMLKRYVRKGIPGEHRGLVIYTLYIGDIYIIRFSLLYFEYLIWEKIVTGVACCERWRRYEECVARSVSKVITISSQCRNR